MKCKFSNMTARIFNFRYRFLRFLVSVCSTTSQMLGYPAHCLFQISIEASVEDTKQILAS